MRLLFCKAYRCLACSKRFFRLSVRRLLAAALTAVVVGVLLALAWPA